jgi:F-type H+-transporting ATPase subunit c
MKLVVLFALLCAFVSMPALAAEAGGDSGGNWALAAGALGLGIAAAGGALGQGRAASEACSGMARNPGASGRIQTALLLALAFIESLIIFTWVMVFLIRGGG